MMDVYQPETNGDGPWVGAEPDILCFSDKPEHCAPRPVHVAPNAHGPLKPLGQLAVPDPHRRTEDKYAEVCGRWLFPGTNVCQKET
jgi:hypothetical protein